MKQNNTPVLLMLFNRAETTQKVFDSLREAKPTRLFIAANGPRQDNPSDITSCQAVRDIFKNIDWPCEVKTNYREKNIGMQPHWRLAMDWFFENVESGIILEDDCVPSLSFFKFSTDLLEKYKDNEKIMHINGSNFQYGRKREDATFYFSKYPHVWGWATWKRSWKKYDNDMKSYPNFIERNMIDSVTDNKKEKKYWLKFFGELYSGTREACDVKWLYNVWANNGLCITPNINMVTNIGFGVQAEHTIFKDKNLDQKALNYDELIFPSENNFKQDQKADNFVFKNIFYKNFFQKVVYTIALKTVKFFR